MIRKLCREFFQSVNVIMLLRQIHGSKLWGGSSYFLPLAEEGDGGVTEDPGVLRVL